MNGRREFLRQTLAALSSLALVRGATGSDDRPAAGSRFNIDRFGSLIYSFGIRARSEPGFDDPVRFAGFCREQGFGGVQVPLRSRPADECQKLRKSLDELHVYVEGIVGLPKDRGDTDRFAAELRTAKDCGATVLRTVMLGGRRYEVFKSAEEFQQFETRSWNSLRLAEPIAARYGLKLAVENHKDYRIDELVGILKRLSSEHIGVCLDTGNNMALLDDPWQVIDTLAPWTLTVHLKDMAVEEMVDGFLLAEVPLGTGLLDIPRIVTHISAANPRARFNLEMMTRDPLRIPCLTDAYWATFSRVGGYALAHMLQLVRRHARPPGSLPRMTGLASADQLAYEQRHVTGCVEFARRTLLSA